MGWRSRWSWWTLYQPVTCLSNSTLTLRITPCAVWTSRCSCAIHSLGRPPCHRLLKVRWSPFSLFLFLFLQKITFSLIFFFLVGVICAAPAVDGAWWRAQVISFYKDSTEVEIRYVDYGGYDRVKIDTLRQIRLFLPFLFISKSFHSVL